MNRKLLILLFFLVSFLVKSQALVWTTSMTDAIALSNEQRKPLLILFTASGTPEYLQNEVFKTYEFEQWSRSNVILVKLDMSNSAANEQNLTLRNAFNVADLPQVCYASASVRKGKTMFDLLGKLSYTPGGGPKNWIAESDLIINP